MKQLTNSVHICQTYDENKNGINVAGLNGNDAEEL